MNSITVNLAAPARGWTSLFNSIFGGRRRPALPLPVHRSVEQSAWSIRQTPIGCVILEEIMQYALSNLHIIQKSLRHWKSRAWGSNSQQLYFMIFERGPRAFVEATCQSLARLVGSGDPSQSVLGSAKNMIFRNIDVLTSMERWFAAFLARLYRKADTCKEGLTGSRDESLRALFMVLDHVFIELEELLRDDVEGQALLLQHGIHPSEFHFQRLPHGVATQSPHWTEELSTGGISLIYQNLKELDTLVSSQLSGRKKPMHVTVYWLPYTCGAIGLSACSLWLLRHSSLMGSPDMDNWIGHAKASLAGFWNQRVEKPISSVGDEQPFKRRTTGNQEARQTEKSLHPKIFQNNKPNILESILQLDQVVKANRMDLQEAMLELGPILEAIKFNFGLLSLGLPLVLLLSVRARALRIQHAEQRSRIARRLDAAEDKLLEFQECNAGGKEQEACCKFGLALFSLDRLYKAVELCTSGTEGRSSRLKEYIFYLAKPGLNEKDQLAVLSRLKDMYR